jgi:hypothetical protein
LPSNATLSLERAVAGVWYGRRPGRPLALQLSSCMALHVMEVLPCYPTTHICLHVLPNDFVVLYTPSPISCAQMRALILLHFLRPMTWTCPLMFHLCATLTGSHLHSMLLSCVPSMHPLHVRTSACCSDPRDLACGWLTDVETQAFHLPEELLRLIALAGAPP